MASAGRHHRDTRRQFDVLRPAPHEHRGRCFSSRNVQHRRGGIHSQHVVSAGDQVASQDAASTSEVDDEAASDTCVPEMANDGRPRMSRKFAVALVVVAREIGSVIVQDLSPFGASRA
jgi:hypothetical protein